MTRARFICISSVLLALLTFLTWGVVTTQSFLVTNDFWFENLMLSMRTPFWLQVAQVITFFGNVVTVIGIGGVVAISLWSSKIYRPYFAGLMTTLGGAAASGYILKELVARARPGGLIQTSVETSPSFPSGHAIASVALYGFVAILFCRLYPERRGGITLATTLVILAIGFSRLYLGVHYPSDVIAGFALGSLWLALGVWVTDTLQSRRTAVLESIAEVTVTEIA